jgi:hypothetical protein
MVSEPLPGKFRCVTVLLATVLTTVPGGNPSVARPVIQQREPIGYEGFAFITVTCTVGDVACRQAAPKPWTPGEINSVKMAMDEILSRPGGRELAGRILKSGVGELRRFAMALSEGIAIPAIAAALQRRPASVAIAVYDRFFATQDHRDTNSGRPGYLFVSQLLLHEWMHAIDTWSDDPEFLKVAGFIRAGTQWRFAVDTPAEAEALTRWDREVQALEKSGDVVTQRHLNRRLALNLKPIRFPTMSYVRGPAEAFAEIGSHLILDPNARNYLPDDLVAYFDRHVFRQRSERRRSLPPFSPLPPW